MTETRPSWADDFTDLLAGVRTRPRPLLPLLVAHAEAEISVDMLFDFLRTVNENDPALVQLRITLAGWDSSEQLDLISPDGSQTPPHSDQRRQAVYSALQITTEIRDVLAERAPLFEKPAIVISKTFEPWYGEARKRRTEVYWRDYETYLRDTKKWSADAITALDETTTDVIERLSDPTRSEIKQTKGLVVGYVQSGKTANFTGVAAKAIDAGFRLIIVLTGTIEILRAQTQRRMDMELMGVENILAGQDPSIASVAKELDYQQDRDWVVGKFVKHGAALDQQGVVRISRVTTHRDDYKRLPQGLTRLKFQRTDKSKPLNHEANVFNAEAYVAVIKKNKAPLEKLIKDLAPLKDDLAQLPVLIIDDESDQASVDTTNPDKFGKTTSKDRDRTAINKLITEILRICPRAQYVGYTATPFANVFVDPDDERDLFPADFVLSLRRPPDYMGVQEFHDVGKRWDDESQTFASSNELAFVRSLRGDVDTDSDQRTEEIQRALDSWVLSGAIKKYREEHSDFRYPHHTMLVHESVKQADHSDTAADVRDLWKTSAFASAQGLLRLKRLFDTDYAPVMAARAGHAPIPDSFEILKPFIGAAIQEMTMDGDPVLVVNSDKAIKEQQKKLDFEADRVWRILVGGTQLSRGFTVEGLTISYFRRKAGQADTLMQAGRWFGFRPGYQDLVRLFIRRDSSVDLYEAFEALLMDEEAFREELRQYEGFDEDGVPLVEPRQIPPLVSQHLPWLRPTARNKMWNAVIESKATAGGLQDLYSIPPRADPGNRENLLDVGVPLIQAASRTTKLAYQLRDGSSGDVSVKLGEITAAQFQELFGLLRWHDGYADKISPLKTFLKKATADERIKEWVVVWPQPQKPVGTIELAGVTAPVIKRGRRTDRFDFVGSDQKHREAAHQIALGQSVDGLPGREGAGVLLFYLVDDRSDNARELSPDNVVLLISLSAPKSSTPLKRDLIQWTVRLNSHPEDAVVELQAVQDS
jgi:hypothetical protein